MGGKAKRKIRLTVHVDHPGSVPTPDLGLDGREELELLLAFVRCRNSRWKYHRMEGHKLLYQFSRFGQACLGRVISPYVYLPPGFSEIVNNVVLTEEHDEDQARAWLDAYGFKEGRELLDEE